MEHLKSLNLKMKLILGFSCVATLGLGTLGALSVYFSSEVVYDQALMDLQSRLDGVATTIKMSYEESLHRKQTEMENWGVHVIPEVGFGAPATVTEVLNQETQQKVSVTLPTLYYGGQAVTTPHQVDELAKSTSNAVTFFANTTEGLVRVQTSIRREDGQRVIGTMIPTTSEVYQQLASGKRFVGRARVLGQWYVSAYEPVMDGNKLMGAFFMGSPDTSFVRVRDNLKSQKILETGYYFALDQAGSFTIHPAQEGRQALGTTDIDGQKIFDDMLEKKNGVLIYRWLNAATQEVQSKHALFQYIPEYDWVLAASVNDEEVQAPLMTLKSTLITTTFGVLFALIGVSYLFGHGLSKHLSLVSVRLNEITHLTTESAESLAKSASTLSAAAVQSAASLEETAASLEEITSQVQNNSRVSNETKNIGQVALTTAKESKAKMEELTASMKLIQEDSKNIREMSEMIDDIAFQTNLLALNAAVEAARAGDHGRGFAVVADAVRNLALKSAESAKSISEVINGSYERVQHGLNAVEKADQSFEEIVSHVENLSTMITEISQASQEQSIGLSQISQAMAQMDSAVQMNAGSAESLSGNSQQLTQQSEDLTHTVFDLTELIEGKKAA